MKVINRIILRSLSYPFILCIILIYYNIHAIRNSILYLMYGGEWNTYSKGDRVTMQDIYLKLKEEHDNRTKEQ